MGDPQTIGTPRMKVMVAVSKDVLNDLLVRAIAFERVVGGEYVSSLRSEEALDEAALFVDRCYGDEVSAWKAHLKRQ